MMWQRAFWPDLDVDANNVLVLRNVGPWAAPGWRRMACCRFQRS